MLLKTCRRLLSLLLLLIISTAQAEFTPVEQLKSFLAVSKTLSADFKQVSLDERGQAGDTLEGQFYLSRPGKFRWYYRKPYEQDIVSTAGKVWFYDADLEQVTIKKTDDSLGSTPALLLSGEVELEQDFILQQQGIDDDLLWIKLTPKNEDSGFKYVMIGLQNGILAGMELSDNFGQLTRIYFSNLQLNPKLDASNFEFVVPEGVDVFHN